MDQIWSKLFKYMDKTNTGMSEKDSALIQNIEVMHTNIKEFEELQLPNHERCATYTVHLIA